MRLPFCTRSAVGVAIGVTEIVVDEVLDTGMGMGMQCAWYRRIVWEVDDMVEEIEIIPPPIEPSSV